MKWFKHYTDASFDSKLCEVEEKFGLTGYAVYFKILEVCAMQWDGKSEPIFNLNCKKTKSILSLNYKKTKSILSLFSVLNLFTVEINETFYRIGIPNLSLIKDNHTKNLQAPGNKVSKELPQEQNRTDKNRTDKIYISPDDVVQLWNDKMTPHNYAHCRGLGSGKHLNHFIESSSFLKEKKDWENLLDECLKIDSFKDNNINWKLNLTWLVNYDNALKVLNGNFAETKKSELDKWGT